MVGRKQLVLVGLLAAAVSVGAAGSRLRPLTRSEAVSTHSPFEMGECEICHRTNRRSDPGPLQKPPAQLCADCHDDFAGTKAGHPTGGNCTVCHSPHNAKKPKLLL